MSENEKPFDGMREHREKPLYQHTPIGVGYVISDVATLEHRITVKQLADRLHEHVTPIDEAIIYDAVDELRRRWAAAHIYDEPKGFGLAPVKAEGAKVPVDARLPSYREAIADRDEFGKNVIVLRRRLRKLKRKLRRLKKGSFFP